MRAERHHRSLQGELMAIVSEAAQGDPAPPPAGGAADQGTRVGWMSTAEVLARAEAPLSRRADRHRPARGRHRPRRPRFALKPRSSALYVAEPPAAYRFRVPAVIDCSVFVAFLFNEPTVESASQLIVERDLHAPWLLDHEIANVADKKRRAGASAEAVEAAIALYTRYDVTMHRTVPADVLALASAYSISAYDAAYLAVASRLKMPLITFDAKLGKAAQRHMGSLE